MFTLKSFSGTQLSVGDTVKIFRLNSYGSIEEEALNKQLFRISGIHDNKIWLTLVGYSDIYAVYEFKDNCFYHVLSRSDTTTYFPIHIHIHLEKECQTEVTVDYLIKNLAIYNKDQTVCIREIGTNCYRTHKIIGCSCDSAGNILIDFNSCDSVMRE